MKRHIWRFVPFGTWLVNMTAAGLIQENDLISDLREQFEKQCRKDVENWEKWTEACYGF